MKEGFGAGLRRLCETRGELCSMLATCARGYGVYDKAGLQSHTEPDRVQTEPDTESRQTVTYLLSNLEQRNE